MGNFIKKVLIIIKGYQFKKLISFFTWIFMIVTPSYLAIRLYKSDIFDIFDIIEIIILCILSNVLLLIISFIMIYNINEKRYDIISEDYEVAVLKRSVINLKSFIFFIIFIMPFGKFWF